MSTRTARDPASLLDAARSGDRRALGRLISLTESGGPELRTVSAAIAGLTGRAHVVGLAGAPGVGKSTATTALVSVLRADGRTVAVLAIDPSSPFTGGALLGDRVRMQQHATDPGVYIRSMASRGHLGGLAAAAPAALRVLDAAGFDVILVETVGIGQAEVDIAASADTTLVLLAPGMGDGIQATKAGIIEVADILVVTKSDRDGAGQTVKELRAMLSLGGRHSATGAWRPPIVPISGLSGDGVAELLVAVAHHREFCGALLEHESRYRARIGAEIEALAVTQLRTQLRANVEEFGSLLEQVVTGAMDPYAAADLLVRTVRQNQPREPPPLPGVG